MSSETFALRDRATSLLAAVGRLSGTLSALVEDRASRAIGAYRLELRRVAVVIALALAAAFFACAAVAFLVFGVLLAFWDTHRLLAVGSVAVALALCALLCIQLMRGNTRIETGDH